MSQTNLDDTAIDAICDALAKNTYLTSINVSHNSNVTQTAIEKLEYTLKNRHLLESRAKKQKLGGQLLFEIW